MEKQLRSLAKADGSYVVTVFDCCREKLAIGPTRGLSQDLLNEDCFNVDEWIGQPEQSQENIIITYGCQPSAGVPAKSTMAKAYFKYLRKSATDFADSKFMTLPGCLNFFQNSDGKCEHSIKTAKPIMLEWDDSLEPVKKEHTELDAMLLSQYG